MSAPIRTFALTCAAAFCTAGIARADLAGNASIPAAEKAALSEVYRLEIPDNSGGWNAAAIPYSIDNSAITLSGYTRVSYYLELASTTNPSAMQFVYAAFDVIPDLDTAVELGVPSNGPNGSKKVIKANVSNLRVYTNAPGATEGFFVTGGNLEFWPSNYGAGANGVFDYDDNGFATSSGHASMQIHNGGLAETLMAYNAWGAMRDSELGVGTQPAATGPNPDWTFNVANNDNFNVQTLQIFVTPVPEPAAISIALLGGLTLVARRRRHPRGASARD